MIARTPVEPVLVSVVSGLDALRVDDVVTTVLLRRERVAVVHPDPSTANAGHVLVRVHDSAGYAYRRTVPLEHGCVPCTLRAAALAELTALAAAERYDALILQLPPGAEADSALRFLSHRLPDGVLVGNHVGVLAADWLDVLAGGSALRDHAAAFGAQDGRFTATVLCASIESASTLVVAGDAGRTAAELADERAVLDLLAPAAVRLRLRNMLDVPDDDIAGGERFDARWLDPLAEYGIRDPQRRLAGGGESLRLVRWQATRPLHPVRLHAALDHLADGVIRSSGRLDVADQPESVVGWDSAGVGLQLGPIAPCTVPPVQRRSHLAFLGYDLDAPHIATVLDGCLLDAGELAIVTSAWDLIDEICPGWPDRLPEQGDTAA